MATATGFTAERMLQIEKSTVVDGDVDVRGHLILKTREGTNIDAGSVIGPQGAAGLHGGIASVRDTVYGIPVTDSQKVALANKAALWYNVTLGRLESYYAVTGTAGLTVPGLAVGSAAGWLPVFFYEKLAKGVVSRFNNPATSVGIGSNFVPCDISQVLVTAGRWYRVTYQFVSLSMTGANLALEVDIRKSVTTDTTATGVSVDESSVVYTAPLSGAGHALNIEYLFKADVTETVNIKAVMKRVAGTGLVDISRRKLNIYDAGAQI